MDTNRAALAFKARIKELDLTYEEVERRLGLALRSGQISRLTSGERKPGRGLAFRIETEFNVPMAWWEIPARAPRAA